MLSSCLYGADPENLTEQDLEKADQMLHLARPYIFSATPINRHASQAVLVVKLQLQQVLVEMLVVLRLLQKARGLNLQYVFPKEGIIRWVDSMAVLKNAPYKENAFKLINFLLRPDVNGGSEPNFLFPNTVPSSKQYIPEAYLKTCF